MKVLEMLVQQARIELTPTLERYLREQGVETELARERRDAILRGRRS